MKAAPLDGDDERLGEIDKIDKLKFLGFLEEIALMVNSGLIDKKIANQSFGFYVRKAWDSPYMWWEGNQQDSEYRILLLWLKEVCENIHLAEESKHAFKYKF